MSGAARARFVERQFLRAQDLADEQAYHLTQERRHNVAHHHWGIVTGLELGQTDDSFFVLPGLAVDGFGRELFVAARRPLNVDEFDAQEADVLDVWLFYDRREPTIASGTSTCGAGGKGPAYRWEESPRLEMRKRHDAVLDPRRPPGVSAEALRLPLQLIPADDPRQQWPVFLGTIVRERTPAGVRFVIDDAARPYVGITAETIDHPARAARIELGSCSTSAESRVLGSETTTFEAADERRFAVFIPEDAAAVPAKENGRVLPRLELSADGDLRLRGAAVVNGDVRLAAGALVFAAGHSGTSRPSPEHPAIYRFEDLQNGDRLRIDLGSSEQNALVIGFSKPDGTFEPCLQIERQDHGAALVTIFGDLVVEGQIGGDATVNEGILPRVTLSEDAQRAIAASFISGVTGANT
jgi:hypothetical protein